MQPGRFLFNVHGDLLLTQFDAISWRALAPAATLKVGPKGNFDERIRPYLRWISSFCLFNSRAETLGPLKGPLKGVKIPHNRKRLPMST